MSHIVGESKLSLTSSAVEMLIFLRAEIGGRGGFHSSAEQLQISTMHFT